MALTNLMTAITLDVYDHNATQTSIKSISCDSNTRFIRAALTYAHVPYKINTSASVALTVIRPDETAVNIEGEPYGSGAATTEYVVAELTDVATAVKGSLLGQFKITDGNQILRTEIFKIDNGAALDIDVDKWAGEYQGYDLSEFSRTIDQNTNRQTAVETRMTDLEQDWETEMGSLIAETRARLAKAVVYPTDTDDEIILPETSKILVVDPDGNGNYEDIPYGNVVKKLLFNAFSEDDSKTKVSITINTSGTPVTGEVRNLRDSIQVLNGDAQQGVGGINITDQNYLWYLALGKSAILPVIPGHAYSFVAKTPTSDDGWYATQNVYFAPDFDFEFATAYAKIPNTDNSIAFSPTEHSDDGVGKLFNGSHLIVPEGMNYMVFAITKQFRAEGDETQLREFGVYDYTEFPVEAAYDKIVDDPVIGNVYNVAYSLINTTSSNNAFTVGGSSQYKTTITANEGKVISSCSVKVGNTLYEPVNGAITINGSASNIKIIAASEEVPDDTYVGAFEVKPDLIPASLLESKLSSPIGLSEAPAGQMLYTNGLGGLILADAPYVPNRKFDTTWEPVFSHFSGGYMYDPSADYAFTKIPESDTIWGFPLRDRVSSTPFNDLIPIEQGERYRYQMPPIMLDRINSYLPGFVIFDANKEVIEVIEVQSTDGGSVYPEFVIPKGGAWMAIHYYNSQTYIVQKEVIKTFDKFDMLNAIHANYRSFLRGNNPVPKTLDKAYICVGSDDIRSAQTKSMHELFTSHNMPYYMASIPEAVKVCIADDPYKTNYDYMQMCLAAGGEIVCHSDDWITSRNIDDFDTLYKYFYLNKKELEFYGFDVHGYFKAGGEGGIYDADPRMDAWMSYFYEYGDSFGYTFPYRWMDRRILEWIGADTVTNLVNEAIENQSYTVFIAHEVTNITTENVEQMVTTLSGYRRGVDYDFITPYELYKKLMPEPVQD